MKTWICLILIFLCLGWQGYIVAQEKKEFNVIEKAQFDCLRSFQQKLWMIVPNESNESGINVYCTGIRMRIEAKDIIKIEKARASEFCSNQRIRYVLGKFNVEKGIFTCVMSQSA